MQNKTIFNKTVYKSKDAMPQDVRQLYEKVMKVAETGKAPLAIDLSEISISTGRKSETFASAQPTQFEHLLSARMLIGVIILIALLLLLFNL